MRILPKVTVLILILGGLGILIYLSSLSPVGDPSLQKVVMVSEGASFSKVAHDLHEGGLIGSVWAFQWLGRLKGVERNIIPGEYQFEGGMRPSDILAKLVTGQVIQHSITIPEGFSAFQIAEVLEEKRIVTRSDFLEAVQDPELIQSLGFPVQSLEGYLFPDTYFLTRSMSSHAVVRLLVSRLEQTLTTELRDRAVDIGMSLHEVLTLASVIEKETGLSDERTLISGVFHNRLRRNIPLQSDPTVIYALEMFDGNIRKRDLTVDSPYNTYRVRGLPPGPIANPGAASIRAALFPASTNFLYFVSRNDGSHKFSSTLTEHNSAVRKYQLRRVRQAS
jgi:UPF0755 protein